MAKSGAEEVPYISILPEGDISTIIDFNSYPNHAFKKQLGYAWIWVKPLGSPRVQYLIPIWPEKLEITRKSQNLRVQSCLPSGKLT